MNTKQLVDIMHSVGNKNVVDKTYNKDESKGKEKKNY